MELFMKKILLLIVAALSFSLLVATPAFAAEAKTGVINMQDLLQKLPQMKKIGEELKSQFGDKQKQLVSAQETFKKDAEKFRRDSAVMSDKDKQAAEDKLYKQQQDLQNMQSELQRDYMAAQNKQLDELMNTIKGVVEKVAAKNNFDLILVNSSVLYANKSMDLTEQVAKEMGV
jgi:outer membrane protein